MNSSVMDELMDAIAEHRVIRFCYWRHQSSGPRTCHPHVLFESSAQNIVMDAVQVDGVTTRGPLPAWRLFDIELITDLVVTGDIFQPDGGLNLANSKKYVRILAHC